MHHPSHVLLLHHLLRILRALLFLLLALVCLLLSVVRLASPSSRVPWAPHRYFRRPRFPFRW